MSPVHGEPRKPGKRKQLFNLFPQKSLAFSRLTRLLSNLYRQRYLTLSAGTGFISISLRRREWMFLPDMASVTAWNKVVHSPRESKSSPVTMKYLF